MIEAWFHLFIDDFEWYNLAGELVQCSVANNKGKLMNK